MVKQLSHIFKEITRGSHERRFEEIFDLAQVVEQNIDVVVVSISPIVKFEKHAQPLDTVASAREPLSRDQAKAKSIQLQLSAVFNRRKSRERKSAYLNQFSVLLEALSFQPVAQVSKLRTEAQVKWKDRTVTVCLDEVEEVGDFVEIDLVVGEPELAEAKAVVLSLASDLGLSSGVRSSYLEMLLDSRSA